MHNYATCNMLTVDRFFANDSRHSVQLLTQLFVAACPTPPQMQLTVSVLEHCKAEFDNVAENEYVAAGQLGPLLAAVRCENLEMTIEEVASVPESEVETVRELLLERRAGLCRTILLNAHIDDAEIEVATQAGLTGLGLLTFFQKQHPRATIDVSLLESQPGASSTVPDQARVLEEIGSDLREIEELQQRVKTAQARCCLDEAAARLKAERSQIRRDGRASALQDKREFVSFHRFLAALGRRMAIDSIFVLSHGTVQLNTDQHNPKLQGKQKRITKIQHIASMQKAPDAASIPDHVFGRGEVEMDMDTSVLFAQVKTDAKLRFQESQRVVNTLCTTLLQSHADQLRSIVTSVPTWRNQNVRVLKTGWGWLAGKRKQGVRDWWVQRFLCLRHDRAHGIVLELFKELSGEASSGVYAVSLTVAAAGISRVIDWSGRKIPQTPLLASEATLELDDSVSGRVLLELGSRAEKDEWCGSCPPLPAGSPSCTPDAMPCCFQDGGDRHCRRGGPQAGR